jgi:hypothetical protein
MVAWSTPGGVERIGSWLRIPFVLRSPYKNVIVDDSALTFREFNPRHL